MQHFSIRAWREYRGAARVRLNTIRLHPDKKRSFVQEDANRLQKIYEEQTCRNDDPENRIIVAVSERNLVRALDNSKATLGDLNHASGSLIDLEFGKQQLLCLDGQSRLKAGLEFLPYDEQWWQVDIVLDTINKEKENIILRRFCNELAPKHGVLYYWIRIAENDGNVKDAKVLRSLLPRTLNNYLTTIDRCELTKQAFDLVLMNVPGLRPQFLLGITRHLHATLCEPEYQHYLESYLFGFWLDLMDQDVEKLNSIDGVTVEKLQGMAPGVSKTDAETLNELFEQRAVFGDFHERDREIIRCKLMSYKGIVPSLNLFHVHYKYLERWAGCMKMLLDKPLRKVQVTPCKEQLKPALRKIFSSNQSNGKCQVEISMNKWRDRSGSFEERFDWSYRQLWLFVMRDHSDEKSCIRGLAYTAQKLGFKSARIDEEAEAYENTQESTNLSRYRPSRRVTIGERISIQGRKAQDWEKEWRKGQHNLFLGEVESHRETAEEVTTLFLQKFIYHAFFGEPISRFWSQVDNHPVDDESSSDSDAINYYDALSETADGSSDDGFEVEQYTVFPEMPPPTSRSTAGTSRHVEQNIPIDANSQRGTGHRAICSSCGGISHVDTPNRLEREQHATISELSTEQTDGGLIDMNEVSDIGEMRTALDSCSVSSPIRFSTPIPSNGSHKCPESPLLGGREGLENQVIGNECVLYDPHGITAIGNHAAAVANTEDMVERVDPTSISQSRGLTTVIQRMNRSDYRYRPYTKKALSRQQNDHVLQAASSYHYLAGRHGKLSKKAVPSARRRQPSDPVYRPVCHSIDDGSNYEHSIHPPAEVDPDIEMAGGECVLYDPHLRHGTAAIGHDAAAVANTENTVERVDPTSISQSRGLTTVIQRMNRSDYRYRPYTKKALSQQQNDHVLQAASSYHYLAGRHGKLIKKTVPSARRRQPSDPVYRTVCHSIDDGSNYEHSIHPPAEVDPDIEMAGGECVLYDPHLRHGTAAIGHDAAAVANTENTVERVDPTSISQSRGLTTVIQRMNRSDYRYRPYTKKALSQQQNDHVLQAASSYHYLAGRHGKLIKKTVPSARRRQPSDPVYRTVCHSIDDGSNYEHSIHPPAEVDPDIEMAGGECVLYDPHLRHGTAAIGHDAAAVANTENTVVRVDPTSISQSRGLTTVIQRMNRSDYRYRPYTKKALSQQQNDHVLQAASSYHYLAGRHGKLSKKAVPSARRRQPSDPVYRPVCHSIDEGSNYEHSIHPPAEADLDIQVAGNAFVLYDRQLEPREATTDNGGDAMEDTGELVWSGDDNSDTAGSTTSSPGDTITELETLNYAHTVATLGSSRSSMVSSRSSVQRSSSSLDKGGLPSVTDISWTLVRSKSVSEMASESPRDPIVSWCPSTVSSPPEPRTSNQSETDLSVGPDIHATAYCISGRICEIEDIPPQAISNLQHFNGGIETVSELGLTDTGSASSASSEPKADTALAATTTKASTLPLPPLQPVAKDVHAEQWHTHTTDDHFASTLPYSEECYILDKDVYEPPPNPKNASSNLRLQPSEAVHNMSHQGEVVARLAKSQLEDTTEPKRTSQSHSTTIDFHQRRILAFNKHLHLRRKDHSPQTQNVSSSTLQTAPADATTSAARFEYQTPPRLDDYVFIVELNDEILVRSMEAAETEQIRHQIQTYEENTHVVFYTKALQRIPRPPSRNPCDPVDILCRLKVLVVMCTKWCIDDNIRAAVSEAVSKEQEIISYMCKKRKISGNVDGDRLLSNEQLYQRDGGERDNWQEYLPMSYREDETIEYTTERSEVALGKRRRNVQYD